MISADDHIDLGYLPKNLWTDRLPNSLKDRAPHVEDRGEKGEYWVCDGETWRSIVASAGLPGPIETSWLSTGAELANPTGRQRRKNGSLIWIATESRRRSCFRRLSPCKWARPS